jgi:protein phosphatase
MQIPWAASSDTGLRREVNEDSYCARPELGLFVVADGMGGHAGGEVASGLAVQEIQNIIQSTTGLGPQDTWPMPFDRKLGRDGNRLRAGFDVANRRIAQHMKETENLRGMATTAVALLVADGRAALAHVGDSRAYRHRGDKLERLTGDHSWVEEQMRAGMLTEAAAREHPWRNIVTRALSGAADLDVEVAELEFAEGDRLLLCSDGLSAVVVDDEIGEVIGGVLTSDLQAACDELVRRANAAGGPDNVTTLLLAGVRGVE